MDFKTLVNILRGAEIKFTRLKSATARAVYLCYCVTPQLLSLGSSLWPLESGTSEIVVKQGQKMLATFWNERAQH